MCEGEGRFVAQTWQHWEGEVVDEFLYSKNTSYFLECASWK